MTDKILNFLRCPICKTELNLSGNSLYCAGIKKHCFDFSKSGYLNFSLSGKLGDAPEATKARSLFLEAGYYQPLADQLETLLKKYQIQNYLDAGCGEGYYTNRLANNRNAIGVDLSKSGIDHAAKIAKQQKNGAGFVVGSLFELPVADESMDAVMNVFAPCAEQEFLRVLKPGGILILVGAGENHLMGLKRMIYETTYQNPGRADLPKEMNLVESNCLQGEIEVTSQEQIQALFSMTPYYWRTSQKDKEKLLPLENLKTPFDFQIQIYQK